MYNLFSLLFPVMSFILKGELFNMWAVALVVVVTLVVAVGLANTDLFLTKSRPASLEELGAADLHTTTGGEQKRNTNSTIFIPRSTLELFWKLLSHGLHQFAVCPVIRECIKLTFFWVLQRTFRSCKLAKKLSFILSNNTKMEKTDMIESYWTSACGGIVHSAYIQFFICRIHFPIKRQEAMPQR